MAIFRVDYVVADYKFPGDKLSHGTEFRLWAAEKIKERFPLAAVDVSCRQDWSSKKFKALSSLSNPKAAKREKESAEFNLINTNLADQFRKLHLNRDTNK